MQARIDSFFQRPAARNPRPAAALTGNVGPGVGELYPAGTTHVDEFVTYKRRRQDVETCRQDQLDEEKQEDELHDVSDEASNKSAEKSDAGKVLNKKRSYAQCFLELGQSDFLLHTCSKCGMKFTRGDEDDEKLHRSFHDIYHRGIPFKGWCRERVISLDRHTGDRILLVLDRDSPAHMHMITRLVKLLEHDLGLHSGWLLHSLCKVYMFVSSNRVVGCVFAEPIKTAHRIINKKSTKLTQLPSTGSNKKTIQFGNVSFTRESTRRSSPETTLQGAILCEEDPVKAICGIRAIWVAPSKRRHGIASKLLDSVRENFEPGCTIELARCAFSQPTSAGMAFASAYFKSGSFLVYNPDENVKGHL